MTGANDARFPREALRVTDAELDAARARVPAEVRAALPAPLREQLDTVHLPLCAYLAERRAAAAGRALVVGLGGGQGAGKSTLAELLVRVLEAGFGLRAIALSLDDFYLTRAERAALAAHVHQELRTRGPGTHDVARLAATLGRLREAARGEQVEVPRFDKARDDRAPSSAWLRAQGPLDVVLLEGVLVGAEPEPEPDAALALPINAFEQQADPDGRLRRHAHAQLAALHAALQPLLDLRVFLAVPDMACVLAWRSAQERALGLDASGRPRGMDAETLARFVQRFERLTLHMLRTLPARADVTLVLDHAQRVSGVRVLA